MVGRILGIPELFGLAAAAVVVALAALVRVRLAKGTVRVTARAVPPIVERRTAARSCELAIEESGVGRVALDPARPRHGCLAQALGLQPAGEDRRAPP